MKNFTRGVMLFRRSFSQCLKPLQRQSPAITQAYINLFAHPCFDPIRNQIPVKFEDMDPYTVSQKIGESLKSSPTLSTEQSALIHNKLIETLSPFEYGIASIHSRKLKDIDQSVTRAALMTMLEHNPGRVSSSWELFVEYMGIYEDLPDKILLTVLNKVVYFDSAEIKNGKTKHDLFDVVHGILLLNKIQDLQLVNDEIIDKLTSSAIELKATSLLPYLLEFNPKIDLFLEKLDELTPYQLYMIGKQFPFEDIQQHKELLYKLIDTLGKNEKISIKEEEQDANKKIIEQDNIIKRQLTQDWTVSVSPITSIDTIEPFGQLLDQIAANELHKSDLTLSKKLLRVIGVFKNDTKSFMELYHMCVSAYPGKEEELFFEAFLSLTYQGYMTSNETALQFAEAYIPETATDITKAKILCIQILANAKFNVDESLNIYNENIQNLSTNKDEITNMAPSDLVTDALILAYLSNRDLDFARVIFEGALRGKILSGATAVKGVKEILAAYGEAVENGDVDIVMEKKIQTYLQNV